MCALRWKMLTCVVLVALASPAVGLTIIVNGSGYTSLQGTGSQTPLAQTIVTNSDGSQLLTASGFQRAENVAGPVLSFAEANASGSAFAGPGVVRARVETNAFNMSFIPNVPFLAFQPVAQGGFQASFRELVEVTHPTLGFGAPISYRITLDVDGFSSMPSGSAGNFYLQWFAGTPGGDYVGANPIFPNGLFTFVPADLSTLSQSFEIQTTVGAFIDVGVSLSMAGFSRAGQDGSTSYGAQQGTVIDVSNTVHLFLDPVTEGLAFSSESGHDYRSSAVPEPGVAVLLLSASVALAASSRRRSRSAARDRRP